MPYMSDKFETEFSKVLFDIYFKGFIGKKYLYKGKVYTFYPKQVWITEIKATAFNQTFFRINVGIELKQRQGYCWNMGLHVGEVVSSTTTLFHSKVPIDTFLVELLSNCAQKIVKEIEAKLITTELGSILYA